MWEAWAVLTTCLLPFSYIVGNRKGYIKGYVTGGRKILGEWKKFNDEMGDNENE